MNLKFGDKNINISKWKGKHKKEFIQLMQEDEPDENTIMNVLVYSCIEEDVILSADEFRFVLSRIRSISLGETFTMDFYCDECKNVFKKELNLNNIITYSYQELKEINVEGARIKLGPIKNKELYQKLIDEDPDNDFILRIERINGNSSFTFDELTEIIENLDVDVLEQVMSIYEEHRFKIKDINTITCECGHEMLFQFDEIPGFFPDSWFMVE